MADGRNIFSKAAIRNSASRNEPNLDTPQSRNRVGISKAAYPNRRARISTARIRLACLFLISVRLLVSRTPALAEPLQLAGHGCSARAASTASLKFVFELGKLFLNYQFYGVRESRKDLGYRGLEDDFVAQSNEERRQRMESFVPRDRTFVFISEQPSQLALTETDPATMNAHVVGQWLIHFFNCQEL